MELRVHWADTTVKDKGWHLAKGQDWWLAQPEQVWGEDPVGRQHRQEGQTGRAARQEMAGTVPAWTECFLCFTMQARAPSPPK